MIHTLLPMIIFALLLLIIIFQQLTLQSMQRHLNAVTKITFTINENQLVFWRLLTWRQFH